MPTVVILLSDKRSGSTMFERELCKHPGVDHAAYTPHSYFETHHWLEAACILGMPKQLFNGHKGYSGYGSAQRTKRKMIDCIKGNVPDFLVPENDEALVFEGWEALCRQYAKPVFFEKSPQHPHHWAALELLMKWFDKTDFKVKFIVLVRNPMSVMYSAQKLFYTDPAKRQFGWASCYRNILSMKEIIGAELFHLVRYEDLISKPRETFNRVFDHIGIEHYQVAGEGVHSRSINKWRDDPMFTLQLHESVVRVAKYFGYEDDDLVNPTKSERQLSEKISHKANQMVSRAKTRIYDCLRKRFH